MANQVPTENKNGVRGLYSRTYMTEINHPDRTMHRTIGHAVPEGIGKWPSFHIDWLLLVTDRLWQTSSQRSISSCGLPPKKP